VRPDTARRSAADALARFQVHGDPREQASAGGKDVGHFFLLPEHPARPDRATVSRIVMPARSARVGDTAQLELLDVRSR